MEPWPSDGSLPSSGVIVHCFDGVEGNTPETKWRPAVALKKSPDHPSTSLIFAEQTINQDGRQVVGIGKQLFGHACANGGVVLKPGKGVNKLLCAHEKDHGAYCGEFCPRALDLFSGRVGVPEDMQPPWCAQAWAPADVHVYLRRATDAYRADHGWGHYNEVCSAPCQLLACLQLSPSPSLAQLRPSASHSHQPPSILNLPMPHARVQFLLDGLVWDAHLPHSVEAFLTSRGDGGLSQRTHDAFLRRYKLQDVDVPLLTLTRSLTHPFVVGTKFAEHGDPEGIDRGPGWMTRPPWRFGVHGQELWEDSTTS